MYCTSHRIPPYCPTFISRFPHLHFSSTSFLLPLLPLLRAPSHTNLALLSPPRSFTPSFHTLPAPPRSSSPPHASAHRFAVLASRLTPASAYRFAVLASRILAPSVLFFDTLPIGELYLPTISLDFWVVFRSRRVILPSITE